MVYAKPLLWRIELKEAQQRMGTSTEIEGEGKPARERNWTKQKRGQLFGRARRYRFFRVFLFYFLGLHQ